MAIRTVEGGRGKKKKKQSGPKLARRHDTKWLGDEPKWETPFENEEDRAKRKQAALKWYSYFAGPGDYPSEVRALAEHLKLDLSYFEDIRWGLFSTVRVFLARMWTRKFILDKDETDGFIEEYNRVRTKAETEVKNRPVERKKVEIKRYSKHIDDLDAVEDAWMLNETVPIVNFEQSNLVYRENLKEIRPKLEAWCNGRIADYEAFLKNDPQAREGFKKLDNKVAKSRIEWLKGILQQIVALFTKPEKPKVERKKKIIPPEKLIRGFRFCKENGDLKSVDPVGIIGARAVALYNPGNRFFVLVSAEEGQQLSVHGSNILNVKSCRATKLRKPEEFLAMNKSGSIMNVSNNFEALSTTKYDGKPKSNNDTIVWRIFR